MSFLKETRGLLTWTTQDLQKSLLITTAQAREVIAALEVQGYIKQQQNSPNEWLTTIHGEVVSGSKPPRFSREKVENALSALKGRIETINEDASSPYRVAQAVAFGDFLAGRAQAQAADVGIQLVARDTDRSDTKPTTEGRGKRDFLRKLRARDLKLNLVLYEPWMSGRSHHNLLRSEQ